MRSILAVFIFLLIFIPARAQNELFSEAITEFVSSRVWANEELPVEWKMKGSVQAEFNEGLNNLLEDNSELAQTNFSSVLKEDPTVWEAYYYRAAARKKLGNLWQARSDLRQALKLHPDSYEANVEMAKLLYLLRNSEESERVINKAIRIDKTRGVAYYIKGDINFLQGQPRVAFNNYQACLAADSLFHDARLKIAMLDFSKSNDVTKALVHLNQVLAYDPHQKTALLFRAILAADKDKEQSVRDLSTLISVSPNNMTAYYARGTIQTEHGNYYQAFSDFRKLVQGTSTSVNDFRGQQTSIDKKIDLQNAGAYTITRVYGLPEADGEKIKEAYCNILTREFDKALAAIEKTSKPNEEPLALYLRAVAYEHRGEHMKAFQNYGHALALDNEISDAHKKRAIYFQEMKQFDTSIKHFTDALRLDPEAFVIYRMRGVSYFYEKRFDRAIADYNAYLEKDSTNKEIVGYRGEAYFQNNQKLNAYTDYAVSGNYGSLDFALMEKLIDSVLVRGDTLAAMKTLEIITNAAPFFTEGYVQRFKLCMLKKDLATIEEKIREAVNNSRTDVGPSKHSYLLTLQAMKFMKENQDVIAMNIFNEAIKMDKKNDLAFLGRGKLFQKMSKTKKAESDFRQASLLGNTEASKLLVPSQ